MPDNQPNALALANCATLSTTTIDAAGDTNNSACNAAVALKSCAWPVFEPTPPAGFCTVTQGGWGATANGFNPGALLAANFPSVGVTVGGGFTMHFTTAAAVTNYLPAGGKPGVLTGNLVNPTSSSSGVFGGQVLTLELNVLLSNANVLASGLAGSTFANLNNSCENGNTVGNILADANTALGGGNLPTNCSLSQLNDVVTTINQSYDGSAACPKQ